MSLFFIGCSHTYGKDLDDPINQAWPALIARAKNSSFSNQAINGSSNERIVYHVIKNSNDYDHYYIAWTYIERFTRYRADNNYEISWNPALNDKVYQDDFSFKEYGKLHYTYWYNELYAFKLWLQQIILVQRYLESKNKSYTMINACQNNINRWVSDRNFFNNNVKSLLCFDQMNDGQLDNEHNEIQTLLKEINLSRYLGWGSWCITDLSFSIPYRNNSSLIIRRTSGYCRLYTNT